MSEDLGVVGPTGFSQRELEEAMAFAERTSSQRAGGLTRLGRAKKKADVEWLRRELVARAVLNPAAPYIRANRFVPDFWGM